MEKSESEKQCDLSNSLTQEEITMLVSGKMTGDEWIAWMVERNKKRRIEPEHRTRGGFLHSRE